MNKKVIGLSLIALSVGYFYVTSKPSIYNEVKDNLKKTATIIIGNQKYYYVHDNHVISNIGKVSLLYSAQILTIENGYSVLILDNNDNIKWKDTFYFD